MAVLHVAIAWLSVVRVILLLIKLLLEIDISSIEALVRFFLLLSYQLELQSHGIAQLF